MGEILMEEICRARQFRENSTNAERLLWSKLRDRRLMGLKFRRQRPIGPYILDFLCVERKLVIELDGGQHQQRIEYDGRRTRWLRSQGYTVLRFWNNEVLEDVDAVLNSILLVLKGQEGYLHPTLSQGGRG